MSAISSELNQTAIILRYSAPASTLLANINASALTFSCAASAGANFPSANFIVTIDTEDILVSSRAGDVFTVSTYGRGYGGTTAAAHLADAAITASTDVNGQPLMVWATISSEPCRLQQLTAKELLVPVQPVTATHRLYLEYGVDVDREDRVTVGSTTYSVEYVDKTPGGETDFSECLLSETRAG